MNKSLKDYIVCLNNAKKIKFLIVKNIFSTISVLNKDIIKVVFPILGAMFVFFGLLFFISNYRLAEASANSVFKEIPCSKVNVSIVNSTDNRIDIIGNNKIINVIPHSVGNYEVSLKKYYTRCGRFDVKTTKGIQKMLVDNNFETISIRSSFNSKGKMVLDTAGVAIKNLDNYVDWNGLSSIL